MGWIVVRRPVGEEPGKRPRVGAGRPVSFWIDGPEGSAAPFGMAAVGSSSSSFAGPVNGDGPSVVPGGTLSTRFRLVHHGVGIKKFGSKKKEKPQKNK